MANGGEAEAMTKSVSVIAWPRRDADVNPGSLPRDSAPLLGSGDAIFDLRPDRADERAC